MDKVQNELREALRCPLTKRMMSDPVIMLHDYWVNGGGLLMRGVSYEKDAVKHYVGAQFVRNEALYHCIKDYKEHFKRKLE